MKTEESSVEASDVKERPILFSAPMVRAILDGRKTQTRRIVKAPPGLAIPSRMDVREWAGQLSAWWPDIAADGNSGSNLFRPVRCPYAGAIGDRLWVRETWAPADCMYQEHECDPPYVVAYRADRSARRGSKLTPVPAYDLASWNFDSFTWRPSIFMPRWASRVLLDVVAVRVERLHAISEDDADAEGVAELDGSIDEVALCARAKAMGIPATECRAWFATLWDSINGKRAAWDSNPWVWVVEFKRSNVNVPFGKGDKP